MITTRAAPPSRPTPTSPLLPPALSPTRLRPSSPCRLPPQPPRAETLASMSRRLLLPLPSSPPLHPRLRPRATSLKLRSRSRSRLSLPSLVALLLLGLASWVRLVHLRCLAFSKISLLSLLWCTALGVLISLSFSLSDTDCGYWVFPSLSPHFGTRFEMV